MKKWANWFNKSFFLAILSLLGVNYGYAFQQNLIENDVLPDSATIVISDTVSIVGASVTLDIDLYNPTGNPINSIQFSVEFDTAMVELEGFNPNEEFLEGFTYLTNDSIPGRVYFSAASAQELLSNGQLAQMSFHLNTIGQTRVQLNNLLLNEGNPPVSILGGQLIIEEPSDTVAPAPPMNLQAALVNASTVMLNWITGQDLDLKQYRVYERKGSLNPNWGEEDLQTPWLLEEVFIRDSLLVGMPAPLQAAMQIQLDGLANLERYYYWVTALDSTGNESLAERVTVRAGDTEIPDAPTLSSVSLSNREITVRWEASTSADVAGYALYRSEASLSLGLNKPVSNSQMVTTSPGDVEWVVLNDWEIENQRHRLFLDLRQFPEEVDPSTVLNFQLFDVYEGPVIFDYVDDSWAYYFIPNQILRSTILASAEADMFRRADEFNMYGIKADLDFSSYTEETPTFDIVDIFTPEQLSYMDKEIRSRHRYAYRVAAFDSVNGDPSLTFDPELRSDFSEVLGVETPAFAWKVNPTGKGDFEYIQDAIQASQAGDTILVDPGKYVEQLRIKHPLTLSATGEWGEVRLVKPSFVDTLITVTADSYTAGRWPQGQSLYLNGFDIWGTEEVATAGIGIAMKAGTKTRLNRVHMTQFVEVFNTEAASYYASNSIFYENRRLGTHSNDLDPDAPGADSVIYRHVNVLNTYDRVSSTEGAVAIEFRNSIIADEQALKLNDSRFQGAGVRFIDVAVDTHEVRTGVDMTLLPASEFEITGYIPTLVHIYTLDQVLFNRLFEWNTPADYRLRPQSKVIGQGRPIPELMKDFAGVSRHIADDKRVDLGAFEHPSNTPILFEAPFLEALQVELPTMDPLGNANQAIELTLSVPDSMRSFLDALYLFKHDVQGQFMRVDTLQPGTFIDSEVEDGQGYVYTAQAVYYQIYESELSDEIPIFTKDVNLPPVVSLYPDVYMHNQDSDRFSLPFTFQAFDADGVVDSTLWLVNGVRYSSERVSEIPVQQGSTHITMIAVDDDGARDTSSFAVYVDAGYTELANSLAPTSGLSLFGNDFVFQPDGKGNLSLMVRNEQNEFSLDAPLRSPVAIASDSSFYLFSGTNNLRKYSLFNWWKHKITVPYWTVNTGGVHESSPIIDEQRARIYAVSTDHQIYAINMRTGAQVWRSNVLAPGIHPGVIIANKYLAQPNILGDIIYFDLDGTITFKELSPIGKTVFSDSLLGALAVGQNQELVAAFSSGKVRKWKPIFSSSVSSQTVWEVELGDSFTTTPVIAEDGMVLVGGADSTFYGLNGSTGQPEWSFKASDAITSTASINEYGVVYFGDRSGRFYALNSKGALLWDYQVPVEDSNSNGGSGDSGGESGTNAQNKNQSILNTINYANGSVFFGTHGGKLVSIRDGWRYDGSLETEFGPEWERSFAQWATYQGNYRRSGSSEGLSATSNEYFDLLPTEFHLSQNYPNPFNPSTKIEFSISEASDVRLEVFNMLGQKVQILKNERMAAGYYSVVFEAGGLSSGVYVYQLTAREFSQTKRMLLVK